MRNAEARVVGDQRATTLSCQRGSRNDGSLSIRGAAVEAVSVVGGALDLRIARGQFDGGVAAGGDLHHLGPLIRLAIEDNGTVRFHGVRPGTSLMSTVPSSPVRTRRGGADAGLSLTSSTCRGTGIGFWSASSNVTVTCRTLSP